jgi:two-component system, OmpR family, sensor histidine kinase ArlS
VKIRTKLIFLYTLMTGSILLIFAMLIMIVASADRRLSFENALRNEAITRANLFLKAEVDPGTLQAIYQEDRQLQRQIEVAVYQPPFTLIYHDAIEQDLIKETPEMIQQIMAQGELYLTVEHWEGFGILMQFNNQPYVVTAAAYDAAGHARIQRLRHILLFIWLAIVALVFFTGRFFAKRALQPVAQMLEKAEEITATNLDLRLNEGKGKDELSELANTFNQMLDRLENSFDAQREFVLNISHEIRTPLTAILGETELALSVPRERKEYEEAIGNIRQDALKLSKLSSSLLDLAKASYDQTDISLREVRIDEILFDSRQEILKSNSNYKVDLILEENKEFELPVTVQGNAYLLKVAFSNLMDNGCKFSGDNSCTVKLQLSNDQLTVSFIDHGPGISEEDEPHIFSPFYRGKNRRDIHGSGIGLPLVQRIINIHKGFIGVQSRENEGTTVTVNLPLYPLESE